MRTKYDSDADALYITIAESAVARTDEVDSGTLVDVDIRGAVVGIEVLRPSRRWPLDEIASRYGLDADVVRALETLVGAGNSPFAFSGALASC